MGGAYRKIQFMLTIDIPFSSKVCFTPLHFYRRPILVPVFFNWKKSKAGFCFFWKKKKWKTKIVFTFTDAVMEVVHQEQRVAPSSCFLGTTLCISASSPRALNCVHEHLCFISIYLVYPLARRVLRKLLLWFVPFRLRKCLIGTLSFWIAGKPVINIHCSTTHDLHC